MTLSWTALARCKLRDRAQPFAAVRSPWQVADRAIAGASGFMRRLVATVTTGVPRLERAMSNAGRGRSGMIARALPEQSLRP